MIKVLALCHVVLPYAVPKLSGVEIPKELGDLELSGEADGAVLFLSVVKLLDPTGTSSIEDFDLPQPLVDAAVAKARVEATLAHLLGQQYWPTYAPQIRQLMGQLGEFLDTLDVEPALALVSALINVSLAVVGGVAKGKLSDLLGQEIRRVERAVRKE